jgi:hypothetical protein
MGSQNWWINVLDNHQAGLQILIILQTIAGTITHKVFNTSTLRCCLYEFGEQACTQPPLSCLVVGLGFCYSAGHCSVSASPLYSSFGPFCRPKLAPRLPDMKHSVQWYTSSILRLSRKPVLRCCVDNLYLSVATLSRNRCLCYNLGDVFQQAVT